MLKKSLGIYTAGLVFGVLSSAVLIAVYPALYFAFLEFLRQKIESQSRLVENLSLMIILNNLLAAGIASFGGVGVSKIVNLFDRGIARRKALLSAIPTGVLFVNGEVLGLLAVLYRENISLYLYGIFPHGFFEIPAIILSGSIGLEISEESQDSLIAAARTKIRRFTAVVLLLIVGGVLEGGAL